MSDEWLDTGPPSFVHAHNGFHYEMIRIRRDFNGPEKIALSNGEILEINPSQLGADKL